MSKLQNFGPASIRMLHAAGIHTEAELRALGAVAAYLAVKRASQDASLNLLWAIESALTGRDWRTVAREDRTRLLLQLDDMQRLLAPAVGQCGSVRSTWRLLIAQALHAHHGSIATFRRRRVPKKCR